MKDYKQYLKSKSRGIKGSATLEPPAGGQSALQSVASMSVLDLISEGPIYGLVDAEGKKANNISILESLYLDDTPVLGKNVENPQIRSIDFNQIQMMGRLTTGNINTAFDNISGQLVAHESGNLNNPSMSAFKKVEIAQDKQALLEFLEENPSLSRFGFIQFKLSGIFPTGDSIYSRVKFSSDIGSYNITTFNLDTYLGENQAKRIITNENGEAIEVPSPFVYGYQFFNNTIFNNYSGAPYTLSIDQQGKVGYKYLIDGFAGGGIYFFEIGDNVETGVGGIFNTGKFFVQKDSSNIVNVIQSGVDNGYDVFVYENSTGKISIESPSSNQLSPIIGEIAGQDIGLGYTSDLNLKYNFGNIDFDFRDGFETQPKMEGHSQGAQDFDIRKKLYGPLSFNGTATDGDGSGYSDPRAGGDFSDWMLNPPLERDSYPYTHTIKRIDVKRCIPTISIEGLSDVIDNGGDAGVQRAETLLINYSYGFEGGVTGSVGALLSGGNSLKDIALGTFLTQENVQYQGIVVSNYLDTYSGIGDLPRNKNLKNLKVDSESIPELTNALISEFGYTSGDYLFPGDDWKTPNRFLKIEKLSFETDSTLIQRECSISYVSEIIEEPFSYPLVALGGTIFDARNFAVQPVREFDIRGKMVAIPSNYEPLNPDGSDKRFIDNSSTYGLREIQAFSGSTYAFIPNTKEDLGIDNYEISLKAKITNTTPSSDQFLFSNSLGSSKYIWLQNLQNGVLRFRCNDNNDADVNIAAYSNQVLQISCKRVGSTLTLTVTTENGTVLTNSVNGTLINNSIVSDFYIGSFFNTSNKFIGTIADLKIKKNNQLLHHWDGTVINTTRLGNCLKDRCGGYHARIIGTVNTAEDSNFEFGKNKKQIYNGFWDGTFKLGWTDNPAWILYDLMINPIYGVGNSLDDREDVNIFNLYKIAQYCDAVDEDGYFDGLPDSTKGLEPRFSCNLRINEPKNAFEVIGNIASIFRGFTYWDGVGLNFAIDKEKEVSAIFNNGNVFDGVFNYGDITNAARFTRIEVLYADAKDQYGTKAEYIEDEDGIRKHGLITNILNGIGCTSKSQARRLGKYVLFSNKMETEITKFRAGSECLFLEPGDIIRIDDELKNFEINYGKVLQVDSSPTDPYVIVENRINAPSIKTGANGGVYLYTTRRQNELENLYDIVKYQTTYQFGEDSDVYSGVVNSDYIDEMFLTEIQKFQITGVSENENKIKLSLDTGNSNIEFLTGVKNGSFFNVELNNNVGQTYKVVKKTQVENNLFDIEAMLYDIQKFKKIETEDFDDEEITYNIGIPANIINRPLAPSVTSNIFQRSDLNYAVTGTITAAENSNETSYRVIVYRSSQAGPYIQKEFLRESDNTTDFEINGLIDGNYTLSVAALRNPESSNNFTTNFTIDALRDVYMNPIIKNIEIGNSDSDNYTRISGSGFGSGISNYEDAEYRFVTVDKKDRVFSLTQLDYTLDIFVEKSGEYVPVVENYENDIFTFDDVDNAAIFGSYNPQFNMKFDLKKDGVVVDSAFFETSVN